MADCGCDFAGTGGELCPEALLLADAVAAACLRITPQAHAQMADYEAARAAYREHVEASS